MYNNKIRGGGHRGRGGRRSFDNKRVDNRFRRPENASPQSKPNQSFTPNKTNNQTPTPNSQTPKTNNQTPSDKNPATNNTTPSKETTKVIKIEETNDTSVHKRERSRSPIDRKVENAETPKPAEKEIPFRYTGRPDEKKFSGKCRLFVANLNTNSTEDDVKKLFEPYGETNEVYFNRDKGFGFIRMDYRPNAETAKRALDKSFVKGRVIQVRFATNASAIEVHGLDQYASNELIREAMSQFGVVDKAVIVCDDRGKSKGFAIVEFEWKKSAQKALERLKGDLFVLGRLPKPIFAKPLSQNDEEDGVAESSLERLPGFQQEREFNPRFIPPNSHEFQLAQKWRDLYLEEQEKKAKLESELEEARFQVELEMETALREQDAMRIREELARRQEELRKIEEDMQQKRQMAQFGHRQSSDRNSFDGRGPPRGQMGPPAGGDYRPQGAQRTDQMQRNPGGSVLGPRPNMMQGGSPGILQQSMTLSIQQGMLPGPRGPPGMQGMRAPMMQGGPGGPGRDMPPRGGGDQRYRPRRN